jgi:rhamnulokinase
MPDALSYMLTGVQYSEYTIASTSQLLDARTKRFDTELTNLLGLPSTLFPPLRMPGTPVGPLADPLVAECHLPAPPALIAVAGHDTASAVVAVPAADEHFAYLSSGTWSLMGIEVKEPILSEQSHAQNFTNEGGAGGTIRFLKNITGMWLLEQCRKEWEEAGRQYTYPEIVRLAGTAEPFRSLIDPNHPTFAHPRRMTEAIAAYCRQTVQPSPQQEAHYIRCIFESLALTYKQVLNTLAAMAPFPIRTLHIIGGGSQNKLLNQMTANATGLPVAAGPSEATAIGNIMMQAWGLGLVSSLREIRQILSRTVQPETFTPTQTSRWEQAYAQFREIQLQAANPQPVKT